MKHSEAVSKKTNKSLQHQILSSKYGKIVFFKREWNQQSNINVLSCCKNLIGDGNQRNAIKVAMAPHIPLMLLNW